MPKANFKTQYRDFKRHKTNNGERFDIDYQMVFDDSGKRVMKPCGETDIQAFIESHAASVDINNIINRYMSGDEDVFEKIKGIYEDVTGMPSNLMEILNIANNTRNAFEALPPEIKEIYNNSVNEFLVEPDRYEKSIKVNESVIEEVKENVEQEQ